MAYAVSRPTAGCVPRRWARDSGGSQALLQPRAHGRPLGREDRVEGGVAQRAVRTVLAVAVHALEGRAEALDGRPRALVGGVGTDRDARGAELVERVPEQEELGLRVDERPPPCPAVPGGADLEAPVSRCDVEVAARSDRAPVLDEDDGEGQPFARVALFGRPGDPGVEADRGD